SLSFDQRWAQEARSRHAVRTAVRGTRRPEHGGSNSICNGTRFAAQIDLSPSGRGAPKPRRSIQPKVISALAFLERLVEQSPAGDQVLQHTLQPFEIEGEVGEAGDRAVVQGLVQRVLV